MSVYPGNYNVLSDAAGSVIPVQLTPAQLNGTTGILFDVTGVGSAPAGVFGQIKGVTLDLQSLTAGTVTLTSPDLPGWQSQGSFGGFQIIRVPGQTSRLQVNGSGVVGGIAALTLWNSTPSSEVQSLANLNATVAGSVTISGIANVAITGTPSVNIANSPAVSITGTPSVSISGTPTFNVGNNVNIAALGNVNIGNAFLNQRTAQTANYTFAANQAIGSNFTLFTEGATGALIHSLFIAVHFMQAGAAGMTSEFILYDQISSTGFVHLGYGMAANTNESHSTIFQATNLAWLWTTGSPLQIGVQWSLLGGALTTGSFDIVIGWYNP